MKTSRIKKEWARAVKKRRTQQNRLVREVAARLLPANDLGYRFIVTGTFEEKAH